MNRSIRHIAFAAASILGVAAVQAADFPASGEFSAADEVRTTAAVNTALSEVRDTTRAERAASLQVNGETGQAFANAPSAQTRQDVRKAGNEALRAHKIPTGEASI